VHESIILKKEDRGEADELVLFLSRDLGRLMGVAKNARKSRVRFGGHLEPFSLVELNLRVRKKDDLVWIDEAHVKRGFLGIRSDIRKVAVASLFLELAATFLGDGNPDEAVFDFLLDFLDRLDRDAIKPIHRVMDEIRLLGLVGYQPRFDVCPVCGKEPIKGEQMMFSPEHGGACHSTCTEEARLRLPLAPETLAVVRRARELSPEAASRIRLSPKSEAELDTIISSFVRYLRGAELHSMVFLEKLNEVRHHS
jgi:DNA repair protein RecO (recombination protein O)